MSKAGGGEGVEKEQEGDKTSLTPEGGLGDKVVDWARFKEKV